MSQKLLREFYELCPDGFCLDLLTEAEKREVSDGRSVYLIGKMHEAERLNGNGRKYLKHIDWQILCVNVMNVKKMKLFFLLKFVIMFEV